MRGREAVKKIFKEEVKLAEEDYWAMIVWCQQMVGLNVDDAPGYHIAQRVISSVRRPKESNFKVWIKCTEEVNWTIVALFQMG